jgi:hypothetical protein
LAKCIADLSQEKHDLQLQLEEALETVERVRTGVETAHSPIPVDELSTNMEDVSLINAGLQESLKMMQLKASSNTHGKHSQVHQGMFDEEEEGVL